MNILVDFFCHVAFPCSNFLAEIPSSLKLLVDSSDTTSVVLNCNYHKYYHKYYPIIINIIPESFETIFLEAL